MSDDNLGRRRTKTYGETAAPMFFMNIMTSVGSTTPSDDSPTVNTVEAYDSLVAKDRRTA
jgi:hypothetical protein